MTDKITLGLTCDVSFPSFKNAIVEAKVDTGATTSSLHATDINVLNGIVTFKSPRLSDNFIRLPIAGKQEVHTADAGGNERIVIKLDVEICGQLLKGVAFNINDRSNMDSEVLLGENILSSGLFTIDPTKDDTNCDEPPPIEHINEQAILNAVKVLVDANISWKQWAEYVRTVEVLDDKE